MRITGCFGPLLAVLITSITTIEAHTEPFELTTTFTSAHCTKGCIQTVTTTTETVDVTIGGCFPTTVTLSTVHATPLPQLSTIPALPTTLYPPWPPVPITTVTDYAKTLCSPCTDYTAIQTVYTTVATTLSGTWACPAIPVPAPTSTKPGNW